MVNFGFKEKTMPKMLINIGALMDIPTAAIITGRKGEAVLNGGLGQATGIVGAGNNYKSTIAHYQMLCAADRIAEATPTLMTTYDTEVNISIERLTNMASGFKHLPEDLITGEDANWVITDKTQLDASEWVQQINKYSDEKSKDAKSKVTYEGFKDPYSDKNLVGYLPTFVEIDSLTEFEASSTIEMLSKDLDSSDTNTYAMKQGAFKTKFLSQLPRISNKSNLFFVMTAHIGEKIDMATGPAKYNQPTKKLQYLKTSDNIKGVSPKFTFLLNNAWFAHTASLLKNQTDKMPEYPKTKDSNMETELNTVKLTQLRSKTGPSGYTLEIVVSQNEGVLPTLTEFHYIKQNGRFGIEGNLTHYTIALRPDVSLNRKSVRAKIDADQRLRRAINITSEILQLKTFQTQLENEGIFCEPAELYKDLKEMGFDWDMLLMTRGYWTINQYSNKVPYLSSIDLLRMRKGTYFPYFLNEDKTLKKQYEGFYNVD